MFNITPRMSYLNKIRYTEGYTIDLTKQDIDIGLFVAFLLEKRYTFERSSTSNNYVFDNKEYTNDQIYNMYCNLIEEKYEIKAKL